MGLLCFRKKKIKNLSYLFDDLTIGIDLGTTNTRVGIYRNDKVDIIPNIKGNSINTIITFSNNETMIGKNSKYDENSENTIYDIKKFIGRKFSDRTLQQYMKLWSFKIEEGKNDNPLIIVNNNNERKEYQPEEILSLILKQLKKISEEYTTTIINKAIIAIPLNFNDEQKKAIIESGKLAEFHQIYLVYEPIAVCIAYGYEYLLNIDKKICIFDFGGGSLDISIFEINNENIIHKYSASNNNLGGKHIDEILIEYCIQEFKEDKGIDVSNNKKALRRIKEKCLEIKHSLSLVDDQQIIIESLANGYDLDITIDRTLFNELCEDIFNECINLLINSIEKAGLINDQIDNIILVGGSSKIPKIQEMIQNQFRKNIGKERINPDEAIVIGTSILGIKEEKLKKFLMDDIE